MSNQNSLSSMQKTHRKAASGTYSPLVRKTLLDDVDTQTPEKSLPSPNFGYSIAQKNCESESKFFKSTSTNANSIRTEGSSPRIVIIGRSNRSPNRTSSHSVSSLPKKDQKYVSEQTVVINQPVESSSSHYTEQINKLTEQKQSIEQKVVMLEEKIQKLTEENQRLQAQLQKKEVMSIEATSSGKYSEMHSTLAASVKRNDDELYISNLETKGKEESIAKEDMIEKEDTIGKEDTMQAVQSIVVEQKEEKCLSVSKGTQFDSSELFPVECARCKLLSYECEGLLKKIVDIELASAQLVKEFQLLEEESGCYRKMISDLKMVHREKEGKLARQLNEVSGGLSEAKVELQALRQEIDTTRKYIREYILSGGVGDQARAKEVNKPGKSEETNQNKAIATPVKAKPPENVPAYLKAISLAKAVNVNEPEINSKA